MTQLESVMIAAAPETNGAATVPWPRVAASSIYSLLCKRVYLSNGGERSASNRKPLM